MGNTYRNLGILAVIVYILGIFWMGYQAFSSTTALKVFTSVGTGLLYTGLGTVLIGLLGFLFLFLSMGNKIDIMYVNQSENNSGEKNGHNQSNTINEPLKTSSGTLYSIEQLLTENQPDKKNLFERILRNICNHLEVSIGVLYILKSSEEQKILELFASYALYRKDNQSVKYALGEGLVGQVAKNGKIIRVESIPEGYIEITSGLGNAMPRNILFLPIANVESEVLGVLELASFKVFNDKDVKFLQEVALLLAKELETNEYYNVSL